MERRAGIVTGDEDENEDGDGVNGEEIVKVEEEWGR